MLRIDTDAIFIVTPNNPTGECVTEANFAWLTDHCRQSGKLLIVDACFRFYLGEGECFDQYRLLEDSETDFLIVEDTGKTWPTQELKAPFLYASDSISHQIHSIYTDFLLLVSPVVLKLLKRFVDLSIATNKATICGIVKRNRSALHEMIQDTYLTPIETHCSSVSWLQIAGNRVADSVVKDLGKVGVHVLPGNQFFWSSRAKGDRYIRIALVRDETLFLETLPIIASICKKNG